MAKSNVRAVIVTTEFRGVFYGHLDSRDDERRAVTLTNARCAIYWGTTRGWLELAETGPTGTSKIGAMAPRVELNGVTAVADVTDRAREAWEARK